MAYNYIEGKLPKFLGLMTDLEELVLTENLLSGSIPEEIQELTNLRRFSIGGNEIAGGIQYLFELTGLEEIYGGFNSLEDVFDNDSFGKLINLRVLFFRPSTPSLCASTKSLISSLQELSWL